MTRKLILKVKKFQLFVAQKTYLIFSSSFLEDLTTHYSLIIITYGISQ